MRSSKLGKNTSKVEVINISKHGLWLIVANKEYFLDFKQYPWFSRAPIDQIMQIEIHHGKFLHWPALDIDVEIDTLENPAKYPLVYEP